MNSPHAIDREDVMAYLDGELPADRVAIVRRHLETCESCRMLAADLREVSARLSEWQVEPSPPVLDVTVRAALEAAPLISGSPESPPRWRWRPSLVWPTVRVAAMTAAAASVIVAAWIFVRPREEPNAVSFPATLATPPIDAMRLEQRLATPEPQAATPGGERPQPQRIARAAPPATGVTSEPGRGAQDAVSEIKVSPQGQRGVPAPRSESVITSPPLSTPVPTTPPPPPSPPPSAQAAIPPPVMTQTTVGVARSDAGAGAGAGRGGRGGAAEARSVAVDSSRNALDFVAFLPGAANRPPVARRAELTMVTTRFDQARADFERVVAEHEGISSSLKTSGDTGQTRVMDAVIRIPVERFDAALALVRALGRVTRDTQASDDLQLQMMGLSSKLAAVRSEETALQDQLVRRRDDREAVLITEQALARAREDRTRLETELRTLYGRVTHGELTIRIEESR
jgi:hypothetical protein